MSSEHSALVNQQAALARHKRDHNAMCLNIDPANNNRIQWCHADNETIKQEITSYNQRLKIYKARVAEAQGQTLFLRQDYSGAIGQFEIAWSMMGVAHNLSLTEISFKRLGSPKPIRPKRQAIWNLPRPTSVKSRP
jgi:hypothetical protein